VCEQNLKQMNLPSFQNPEEIISSLKLVKKKAIRKLKHATIWRRIRSEWEFGMLKPIVAWLVWIFVGTVFYGSVDFEGNYCKGFYFAVNVGYSVGWGVLHERRLESKYFSVAYLLIGASAISGYLAYMIRHTIDKKGQWQDDVKLSRSLDSIRSRYGYMGRVYASIVVYAPKISHVLIWVVYVIFGTSWSCRFEISL
jgi:hypothetical protein